MGEEAAGPYEVKYAPFYRSFHGVTSRLPDAERLAIYDAVTAYCFDGVYPDFSRFGGERGAILSDYFALMAPNIDTTIKKMAGGPKGGRPKGKKAR